MLYFRDVNMIPIMTRKKMLIEYTKRKLETNSNDWLEKSLLSITKDDNGAIKGQTKSHEAVETNSKLTSVCPFCQ